MLNKQVTPTIKEMEEYCGENEALFSDLNDWLKTFLGTDQKEAFLYGNNYGWCVEHRRKGKLICNVFAEKNAFSVMLRLSDKQYASVYTQVGEYTKKYIDNKYPCSNGGWVHYRVLCKEHYDDIQKLLEMKCS